MIYLLALSMGFLGSLHCIGMCGPLVLSFPFFKIPQKRMVFSFLYYHLGRILVYMSMGSLVGILGKGISLGGFQQYLAIFSGLILIVYVAFTSVISAGKFKLNFLERTLRSLRSKLNHLFKKYRTPAIFSAGILNGLLPCGLLYAALITSIASGSLFNNIAYMAFFGMGTLPAMVFLPLFYKKITAKININKMIPYLTIMIGILLVLRGMNLGIPYISPSIDSNKNKVVSCH